jgi:hypothetical protein
MDLCYFKGAHGKVRKRQGMSYSDGIRCSV